MPKPLAHLALTALLVSGAPAIAQQSYNPGTDLPDIRDADDVDLYSVTAAGGMACMLAAGKNGVDTSIFDKDSIWVKATDGAGYKHESEAVEISFPADSDGSQRICVVEAELASQSDQLLLARLLIEKIGQAPQIQEDNIFWIIGGPTDFRGLQLYPDEESVKPKVCMIGAAF